MAVVDLYGGDAERIRGQYRSSLGRDASDDEVSGWLSGSYGGGGLDDWLRQIDNSDEARRRRPDRSPSSPPDQQQPPFTIGDGRGTYGPQDDDPWLRARNGLRNMYRWNLGRDASDDEINNWLSGAYGYGSGVEDYDKYVWAIMGSPEARRYRPQYTGDPNLRTLEYWQSQGVPSIDIFDPMTGQLKPGWQRTAKGYERTGAQTNTQDGGDLQQWIMSLLGGNSSPQALAALEQQLAARGVKLQKDSAGNVRGRLYLPDGRTVDLTNGWGQPWTWIDRGKGGGPGHGGPGDQYNDPYTQWLEQMIKQRIGNLGPVNDPNRDALMEAYRQRIAQLQNAAEPNYQKLVERLNARIKDLGTPGYTGAEGEAIRTGALDPIERDRQAARKRALERISAMGYTPESGVAQQLLQEIDREFDAMRASTQTALTTNDIQRRESRASRADSMQSALYDISEARSQEALDVFGAIEALSALARSEDEARNREQISLGGALADLGPQRLQLAMQAAGMAGNYTPLSSTLMALAGLNQNAALMNSQQRSSWMRGIGSTLYYLSRSGL